MMLRYLQRAVLSVALGATLLCTGCSKTQQSSASGQMPVASEGVTQPAAGPTNAESTGGAAKLTIQTKGSDTLLQVAQALAEAYQKEHPEVEVAVTGGGSGTGFQALIEGTTDIANSSRKIKDEEIQAARAKGIEPEEHIIGYDGIAVIVHKSNPVEKLTIDQLSDLYIGQIPDWKALGGKGEVSLLSRDSTSGTYEYFKEHVVQKGDKKSTRDFGPSVIRLPSTTQIREQVASTEGAIGYIGLGYLDDTVKAVAVVGKDGKAVRASVEAVQNGTYPISRPLFMYIPKTAPAHVKAYLEWVLSAAGQKIVAQEGFVPLKKQ